MKDKPSSFELSYNDSDIGYFDDYFVEEVGKDIKNTLTILSSDVPETCLSCDIEYHDKKGCYICNNCGKVVK